MDEIQLCNPIGSYNHKVVQVYFSLGNIPAKFRSRYHSINLLSIFYNEQVEAFGLDELLKPIVEEIKKLEDGVEFKIINKYQGALFEANQVIILLKYQRKCHFIR